jgi:hypothetical protein
MSDDLDASEHRRIALRLVPSLPQMLSS